MNQKYVGALLRQTSVNENMQVKKNTSARVQIHVRPKTEIERERYGIMQ